VLGGLWQLSTAALGAFLAELPASMALTRVVLDDGREVVGFTCTQDAVQGARDITSYGGWLAFLDRGVVRG
jgi:allophanate hydrolase